MPPGVAAAGWFEAKIGCAPALLRRSSDWRAHIARHNVTEDEVEEILTRPLEDRPGFEGSRVAVGRTEAGRLNGDGVTGRARRATVLEDLRRQDG
jgi:hypothetical protein